MTRGGTARYHDLTDLPDLVRVAVAEAQRFDLSCLTSDATTLVGSLK